MEFILTLHSVLRWIIIVVAALAVVKFAIGWATNASFKGMDRGLAAGFSGLMDAQVLRVWSSSSGADSTALVFPVIAGNTWSP